MNDIMTVVLEHSQLMIQGPLFLPLNLLFTNLQFSLKTLYLIPTKK